MHDLTIVSYVIEEDVSEWFVESKNGQSFIEFENDLWEDLNGKNMTIHHTSGSV